MRPRVLAAANYSFQTNILQGLTEGKNLARGAGAGISIHELRTHHSHLEDEAMIIYIVRMQYWLLPQRIHILDTCDICNTL